MIDSDEGTSAPGGSFDLIWLFLRDFRQNHCLIQWPVITPSRRLHHRRQKGLRIE